MKALIDLVVLLIVIVISLWFVLDRPISDVLIAMYWFSMGFIFVAAKYKVYKNGN